MQFILITMYQQVSHYICELYNFKVYHMHNPCSVIFCLETCRWIQANIVLFCPDNHEKSLAYAGVAQ